MEISSSGIVPSRPRRTAHTRVAPSTLLYPYQRTFPSRRHPSPSQPRSTTPESTRRGTSAYQSCAISGSPR
ncbi:hypothetical protein IEO21_04608 [Rhodonia placenta]|uniref:Uncharacterized protein n=1 Tax=Rhodonia placenta TaxID=104341 RepID=A0A8H7P3I3_9APHY|nr:hypothetical protein IEO21_04608 [Postia placenta]